MKIGLGFRAEQRTDKDYIKFASQIGVTHAVIAWPGKEILPSADKAPWSVEELMDLRKFYEENGVKIEGFENFHPSTYYKAMLDLPGKKEHLDYLKTCISNMGKAGIPVMGYNPTFAGVIGRETGPFARGGAETVRFTLDKAPINDPFPVGEFGKRIVIPDAPKEDLPFVSLEENIQRRDWLLSELLPVAEEAGVKLAAHPEDPPIPVMRNTSRILINQQAYDDMFEKFKSPANCIEFCQGTFTEMGVDVYKAIEHFVKLDRVAYVHFRNVRGTIDHQYTEEWLDDGDVDMVRALKTYRDCGYKGLVMPDHTPLVSIDNATAIGMSFAIGYIRGIMQSLDIEIEK
ncbi:MAG: mannonate dehydratase [Clostridia bacterium]